MKASHLFFTLLILALYGTQAPFMALAEVKQASIKVTRSWNEGADSHLGQNGTFLKEGFPDRQWWEGFNDSNLNTYINAAIHNNPTLNGALRRVEQARAMTGQTVSKALPSVNFNPSAYRIGLPDNVKGALPLDSTLHLYNLPLQASYELDLWGKNLDSIKSSRKQADSAELQGKSVLNSIVGEVAAAYVNLIRMDGMVEAEQQRLTLLKRIAALEASQHQSGLIAYDEVLRAQRDVAEAETNVSVFEQQQAVFAHQLSILTGSPPANASQLQRAALERLSLPKETASGLPSELLTRRPDILAQERLLESASIDVRVARKAFLPTINLGAMVGSGALGFKNLWSWGNVFNMQSLAISQPIFKGGQLKSELNYRKAKQKEQLETYRQTILTALKDVEDSLSMLRSDYQSMDSNTERLTLTQKNLALTDNRYQQGLAPKLDVLQAQSELLRYQQTAIQTKADTAIATVSLYKALGGGF